MKRHTPPLKIRLRKKENFLSGPRLTTTSGPRAREASKEAWTAKTNKPWLSSSRQKTIITGRPTKPPSKVYKK